MIRLIKNHIGGTELLVFWASIRGLKRRPFESNGSLRKRITLSARYYPSVPSSRRKSWTNALQNLVAALTVIAMIVIVCLAFVQGLDDEAKYNQNISSNISRMMDAQKRMGF